MGLHRLFELNRATVDAAGTVTLADGTVLEEVEMLTAPMLAEPTDLDRQILAAALKVIEGGESCFRSLQEDVPAAHRAFVPDIRQLDWGRLRNLKTPPLKQLVAAIKAVDSGLEGRSNEKIANTLCKFGVRVPIARPRISRSRKRAKA